MKFEPSLQLKVRTTPGNQESFATKNVTFPSTDEAIQEYLQSLQALVQDEIIEADKVFIATPINLQSTFQPLWGVSTGLHYAPDQTSHGRQVEQRV